uniref:Uncharacterized protein n=1 Tax=Mus musculus TaxID=10090 RepID=Q3U275_MOUSE|nr:unnamed protein product [Mus musculus]
MPQSLSLLGRGLCILACGWEVLAILFSGLFPDQSQIGNPWTHSQREEPGFALCFCPGLGLRLLLWALPGIHS